MKKILIAMSGDFSRGIYDETFSNEGLQTMVTDNGKIALRIAKEDKPDMIIADIFLSEMGGFELIKRLKEDKNTEKIPVIIYSRTGNIKHREKAMDLEARDFISGVSDSPKEAITRVKIHSGKQKGYLIKIAKPSLDGVGELARDLGNDTKCATCGGEKSLYLIRNLQAGETDFKVSFVCPECSFGKNDA